MRKSAFLIIVLVLCATVASPALVAAAQPGECPGTFFKIPCGCDNNGDGRVSTQNPPEACTFDDLVIIAQRVIQFLIFKIAAPLAAIMFAYAGFLYLTNMGNEAKVKQAHDIFTYVFIGLVVALAAWLVIYTIVNFFLNPTYVYLSAP